MRKGDANIGVSSLLGTATFFLKQKLWGRRLQSRFDPLKRSTNRLAT
jgi:hypothetical protein